MSEDTGPAGGPTEAVEDSVEGGGESGSEEWLGPAEEALGDKGEAEAGLGRWAFVGEEGIGELRESVGWEFCEDGADSFVALEMFRGVDREVDEVEFEAGESEMAEGGST